MIKFGVESRMAALVAAVLMVGVSPAAMAHKPDPKGSEAPAATDNGAAPAQAKSAQRYCFVSTVTGSRIPNRICKTRDEWLQEGVDPLAKDD